MIRQKKSRTDDYDEAKQKQIYFEFSPNRKMKSFLKSLKFWFLLLAIASAIVWWWEFSHLKNVVVATSNIWPGGNLIEENTDVQWRRVLSQKVEEVYERMQQGLTVYSEAMVGKGEVFSTDTASPSGGMTSPALPYPRNEFVVLPVNKKNIGFYQFRKLTSSQFSLKGTARSRESAHFGPCRFYDFFVRYPELNDSLIVMLELPVEQVEQFASFCERSGKWETIDWQFSIVNPTEVESTE